MAKVMTVKEFLDQLTLARNSHNIYVSGGFGVSLRGKQLDRYTSNYPYNIEHADKIRKEAENQPLFGFDCIGLVKAILWGWCADPERIYGGAVYQGNGIKDYSTNSFFKHCCENKQKVYDGMPAGLILHIDGHIGVTIGSNLALECTQRGEGKIRVSRIKGLPVPKEAATLPERSFDECGECIYIDYSDHTREKGDVNGDGQIDARDYMLCKRIVLKTYQPTPEEYWAADINDDGKVTALDYIRLKRIVLKQ